MPWIPLVGITLVLGVLLAGAASFLWDIGLQLGIAEGWPETTFIYEHGHRHGSDGDRKFITRYRLTYYGRNDWFEEVLPHGTFPQPRSTRRMEGRVYTEHDLDTGLTETEVIGESTIFSPSGWFFPQPFALHEVNWDGSPRLVETDVKVCFRAREIPGNVAGMACRNNAPAWRFGGRQGHSMFLDDRRGIPMGGSAFKMAVFEAATMPGPAGRCPGAPGGYAIPTPGIGTGGCLLHRCSSRNATRCSTSSSVKLAGSISGPVIVGGQVYVPRSTQLWTRYVSWLLMDSRR